MLYKFDFGALEEATVVLDIEFCGLCYPSLGMSCYIPVCCEDIQENVNLLTKFFFLVI